ncbi:MAG: hypothetical protein ACSHX6_09535 [Akkermansiaceae bacterium]
MKNIYQNVIKSGLAVAVFAFASCASEQTVTQAKVRSGLDKYNNGYEMEKGDHGMARSGSDKVSSYNNRRSDIGSRDFSGKDYNKESYRKERWGGNKDYASKQYGGNMDGSKFKHSPHYVNRNASAQANGQYATANQSQFNAGKYATGRANEARSSEVQTSSNGYVISRNRTAQEPLIMSRDEYNQLGVQQTNSMLGR